MQIFNEPQTCTTIDKVQWCH